MNHGSRRGFSLTEVVVSILITAVVVLSVFAVSVTARRNVAKYDLKVAANNGARLVLGKLGNYVTADDALADAGPNRLCANTWTLPVPGNTCGNSRYALAPGASHDVTAYLPAYLRAAPYNMVMYYVVVDNNPIGYSVFVPSVTVTVQWNEVTDAQ